MKRTTKYLYNIEAIELATLNYQEALYFKISCAKELIAQLVEVHHSKRDDERVNAVFAAIEFNKGLIKELNE